VTSNGQMFVEITKVNICKFDKIQVN